MADELTFNTASGAAVERKQLVLYLNTGTSEAPVWSPVGKGVEESSGEYDWGEETKTDIFGITKTTFKKPTVSQHFDPWDLGGGDVAQIKIWNQAIRNQDVVAMANNDLLVVHAYTGDPATGAFAERWPASAVKPSSLGGSATVAMPIDVTYGGERSTGTAVVGNNGVTFTDDTAA